MVRGVFILPIGCHYPAKGFRQSIRRSLQPLPGPEARRPAAGRVEWGPLHRLPPEPRPSRQSGAGRPPDPAAGLPGPTAAGGEPTAALALRAAAVHGGGVRRGEAVPLLLLVRRPAVDPGRARRACERI